MKKVISLLLVLVLCMYLPCAVFAVSSPGNNGEAPSVPTTPPADNPVTGDTFAMGFWVAIMLIALLAIVILLLCYRKFTKR